MKKVIFILLSVSTLAFTYASTPAFLVNSHALTRFQDTTGFDPSGLWQTMASSTIILVYGTSLNVLFILRYYIMLALIIGVLLNFTYRAFKFYKV